jgi:hypothetical protein
MAAGRIKSIVGRGIETRALAILFWDPFSRYLKALFVKHSFYSRKNGNMVTNVEEGEVRKR